MSLFDRPRDERGGVAPFVAVLVVLLVGLASFAVDLGYQRVAARDMQAVADIVAMDMARQLDGTKANVLKNRNDWQSAVRESLARNDDRAVGDDLEVVPCNDNINSLPNGKAVLCATPGVYDPASRTFSSGGNDPATHVRVLTRTRVDYFFPIFTDGGWVTKTAYAQAESGACFTVGSYAARVRLGDGSILGPLLSVLGTDVGLSLLDAQGLVGADIKIVDLVSTDLVAGGFDELVNAEVRLGDLYIAMAEVLERSGEHAAQVSVLHRLATAALRDTVIKVGDLVGIDTSNSAGLDAVVNVFDLVSTAAFVANGDNTILVPDLSVDVAGLSTLKASVRIGQKPILRCGRPQKVTGETSQVEVSLSGRLVNLNLGLVSIKAPIRLTLTLAPVEIALDAVACLSPQRTLDFLARSGLVDLEVMVGEPANDRSLAVKALFGLLTLVDGHIRFYTSPAPSQSEKKSVSVIDENYDAAPPAEFGTRNLGIPHLNQDIRLDVLGILPAGGLLGVVVKPLLSIVVNPLVQGLDALLLSPLLGALGIKVSGADVYARPKADCGVPALRG